MTTGWKGRGSRHARGYGAAWDRLRAQILERDHFLCVRCAESDRVRVAACVDHIRPKAQGGTDDESNLRSLCRPCHDDVSLEQQGKRRRSAIGAEPKRPKIPMLNPRIRKL